MSKMNKTVGIENSLSNPSNEEPLEMYNVTKPKRGFAVIINNYSFSEKSKLRKLCGGKSDTKRLDSTLGKLGFIVKKHENLDVKGIITVIQTFVRKDHKRYGCFLCVLSSHGTEDYIFGTDGRRISVFKLINCIADCKTLQGKPKLFFVDKYYEAQNNDVVIPTFKEIVVKRIMFKSKNQNI